LALPNGEVHNLIDYIMIQKRYLSSLNLDNTCAGSWHRQWSWFSNDYT